MQSVSSGPSRVGLLPLHLVQAGLALSVTAMVKSPACMPHFFALLGHEWAFLRPCHAYAMPLHTA